MLMQARCRQFTFQRYWLRDFLTVLERLSGMDGCRRRDATGGGQAAAVAGRGPSAVQATGGLPMLEARVMNRSAAARGLLLRCAADASLTT